MFTALQGAAPLLFGYRAFVEPERLVKILILAPGAIALLAGPFLPIDGYGMRNAAGPIETRTPEAAPSSGPRPGRDAPWPASPQPSGPGLRRPL